MTTRDIWKWGAGQHSRLSRGMGRRSVGPGLSALQARHSWDQANNHCNLEENASLVEIFTPEQHEYIILELELLADSGKKQDWWTSGTDVRRQGRWFWVQSLELVEEFVWGEDEPNTPTNNFRFLSAAHHFMAYDPTTLLRCTKFVRLNEYCK